MIRDFILAWRILGFRRAHKTIQLMRWLRKPIPRECLNPDSYLGDSY